MKKRAKEVATVRWEKFLFVAMFIDHGTGFAGLGELLLPSFNEFF
jgi:hypothetical protein